MDHATEAASASHEVTTFRHQRQRSISHLVLVTLAAAALSIVYGYGPGMLPNQALSFFDLGVAHCMNNSAHWWALDCRQLGYPGRYPLVFGAPVTLLNLMLAKALHLHITTAWRLAYFLLLAIAVAGDWKYFRRLGADPLPAWIGIALFLLAPVVWDEAGYGALRIGFALLPTYVLLDSMAMDRLDAGTSRWRWMGWLLAICAARTFALFCDGYSFVMSLIPIGLGWLWWMFPRGRLAPRKLSITLLGAACALASLIVSVGLYKAVIPANHFDKMPLDFFRGQGVDLFAMLVPSRDYQIFDWLGWHHNIDPLQAYSDGKNISVVYIGASFLICALATVIIYLKKHLHPKHDTVILAATAIIAFVLSLGPSLKWHDFRPSTHQGNYHITFQDYQMPADSATANLHTAPLYLHAPGISMMRALYRWQLLVRLALVVAACLVLTKLGATRAGRVMAVPLTIILLAETIPPISSALASYHHNSLAVSAFDRNVVKSSRALVKPGSHVMLMQLNARGGVNPYLANQWCPQAGWFCFNAGGDKAEGILKDTWPAAITELNDERYVAYNARKVLERGTADAIVVAFFDMRWDSYSWPPHRTDSVAATTLLHHRFPCLPITVEKWYAVIRPPAPGTCPPSPPPLSTYTLSTLLPKPLWGPSAVKLRDLLRSSKKITVWLKVPNAPQSYTLALDDQALGSDNSPDTLYARLNIRNRTYLVTHKLATVYLVDRDTRQKQTLGTIELQN